MKFLALRSENEFYNSNKWEISLMRLCIVATRNILQVRFCLCIVLIVHWIFMNPIRNPAIKFFRAKVVFEIIDSNNIIDWNNNSTNIAEINNSFVVIDSHLSTRVSKKRTNAFSLSYINAWKKKYVTTYIRKRREKKETQSNSIFHGSVTQRFVFCFVSFRFFSPPQPCYFNTQRSSTCFSTPF